MTAELPKASILAEVENIKRLFGPPPVFRSENVDAYDAILMQCIESIKPRNFLERMQVKHMADDLWKTERYKLHQAVAVNRREQAILQLNKQRAEIETAREARKDRCAAILDGPTEEQEFQKDAGLEACNVVYEEVMEHSNRFIPEFETATALEQSLAYYDRLEWLENGAIKRFNDAFNQIERYRQSTTIGLPGRQVIDAHSDEIEKTSDTLSLAPPMGEFDD